LNNDGNNATDRTPGSPRNAYRMPGIVTLDLRVTRTFNVGGRTRLQFIGEAFNVFNRVNIAVTSRPSVAKAARASRAAIGRTKRMTNRASERVGGSAGAKPPGLLK
jgi:hypothetical protein